MRDMNRHGWSALNLSPQVAESWRCTVSHRDSAGIIDCWYGAKEDIDERKHKRRLSREVDVHVEISVTDDGVGFDASSGRIAMLSYTGFWFLK